MTEQIRIEWEEDQGADLDDAMWDDIAEYRAEGPLVCVAYAPTGEILAVLGSIVLSYPAWVQGVAQDPYIAEVERDIRAEAEAALVELHAAYTI